MDVKYGTKVLVTFDTIVDTAMGVLNYVFDKFDDKFIIESLKYIDTESTKCLLVQRSEFNPLKLILKPEYDDKADSLYNEIITNHYQEVVNKSMKNALFYLSKVYDNTHGIIRTTVLCKNKIEEQFIRENNTQDVNILLESDFTKVDLAQFDSMMINNFYDILLFRNVQGKSIFIHNCDYNLQTVNNVTIPKIEISALVSSVNNIYTIDPYVNLNKPI